MTDDNTETDNNTDSNVAVVRKYTRMSYEETDADITSWMQHQSSRSGSLRALVSVFVAEYGAVDVMSVLPQMFSRVYGGGDDSAVVSNAESVVNTVNSAETNTGVVKNNTTIVPKKDNTTDNADNIAATLAHDMFD